MMFCYVKGDQVNIFIYNFYPSAFIFILANNWSNLGV